MGCYWAFIPARGGSESIALKNMAMLGGEPLISWALKAACSYNERASFDKIIVSTDSKEIKCWTELFRDTSGDTRIVVTERPEHLTDGKSYRIDDVVVDYIKNPCYRRDRPAPDVIVLIQPTSPFVREDHIDSCISALGSTVVSSAQTITKVAHNNHWVNQRVRWTSKDGGDRLTDFRSPLVRDDMYNSNKKVDSFIFGNLVATAVPPLLDSGRLFCQPSVYVEIDRISATDVDTQIDLDIANAVLKAKLWERYP